MENGHACQRSDDERPLHPGGGSQSQPGTFSDAGPRHIRHIPIVDQEFRFQGLLTHRDLLEMSVSVLAELDNSEQAELHRKIPIRRVMKSEVYSVPPETPAEEIVEAMLENKYGCVPVVSEEKLIGIITEADFLRLTLVLLRKQQEE